MSIVQLQEDLQAISKAIPDGPLVSAAELRDYIRNNLVPFLSAQVSEVEEMDGAISDIVNQSEDVLHQESAEVFIAIITSGLLLINELATRIGNDQRLLAAIKEWKKVAKRGEEIVNDITIPDDEDEDPDEVEASTPADASEPQIKDPS